MLCSQVKNRTSCYLNHASRSHEIPELRITILSRHILQLRSPAEYVLRVIWAKFIEELTRLVLAKGHVKLIKWVRVAHSFLQSVSDQFHVIILSLPV